MFSLKKAEKIYTVYLQISENTSHDIQRHFSYRKASTNWILRKKPLLISRFSLTQRNGDFPSIHSGICYGCFDFYSCTEKKVGLDVLKDQYQFYGFYVYDATCYFLPSLILCYF